MLRKVVSGFGFSCIKKRDAGDDPELQNDEYENAREPNTKDFPKRRPKSSEIPIPSRSLSAGNNECSAGMHYDIAPIAELNEARNKCRQRAEAIEMSEFSRQDVLDLDAGFQFPDEEPKAESNASRIEDGKSLGSAQERTKLPKNCLIKIGSIVDSSGGSLPRIIVAEEASEQLIFRLNDVESMIHTSMKLQETGIYYNTNTGMVELHGGNLHNDYTI